MVDFIVTVLLALIIFTPTCYFGSKLFRLSDQATDNFAEVVANIKDVAKDNGNTETKTLIMDQDTAIVTFKANQPHEVEYGDCGDLENECENKKYRVERDTSTSGTSTQQKRTFTSTTYPNPSQCKGEDCICLCQERKLELQSVPDKGRVEQSFLLETIYVYQHEIATCTKLACETLNGVNVAPFHYYREEDNQRRLLLEVTNAGGTVQLKVK